MPAGDGTGPMGMGPMTGRAAGFCAGFGMPGTMNPMPGRGFGMGFGRGRGFRGRGGGRGWRNMYHATGWSAPTREQQLETLRGQAEYFESALGDLRKRIEELEG